MAAQTADPHGKTVFNRALHAPYVGAEAIDISAADASPTRTDAGGVALIPRGISAQIAGLVKVDLADGTEGVTLAVVAGCNPLAVMKTYKVGTDAGLVGKIAWLY